MEKRKVKDCGKAFFQIAMLIIGVIAFSYIVSGALGADKYIVVEKQQRRSVLVSLYKVVIESVLGRNLVSAVEIPDEDMAGLREVFPDLSDNEVNDLIDSLILGEYITVNDISNPQAVADATEQAFSDYHDAIESGSLPDHLMGLFNFLDSIAPPAFQISGEEFAQDLLDMTGGEQTCPVSENGKICQEFFGYQCDEVCAEQCIDKSLAELPTEGPDSDCALGMCYDPGTGICVSGYPPNAGATKKKCEDDGGDWYAHGDVEGETLCTKGCCLFSNQGVFETKRQCEKRAEGAGKELGNGIDWGGDIQTEVECLAEAAILEEGACIYPSFEFPNKNDCKFVTAEECIEINGEFFEDTLCSHPDLNTVCVKQNSTSCFEEFDEVYWVDSCGNKENIFDVDLGKSWNGGMILEKNDSCNIATDNSFVGNQATCGNCNRLFSSVCGNETIEPRIQELNDDPDGDVVCLDLACYDGSGNKIREHGESWCAYQGSVGMPGPEIEGLDFVLGAIPANPILSMLERSTDTPGSTHFRMSCEFGEIKTSACENLRNGICEETRTEKAVGGTFSQATCRANRWAECLAYNPDAIEGRVIGMTGKAAKHIIKAKLIATCGIDPDCFVKDVKVDDFAFSYCAPRYAPGFMNPEDGEQICSQASQTCTQVWVKELSGWKCKANCDCDDQTFAQQMHDLCTSLGDCGFQVNYVGMPPGKLGYSVKEGGGELSGMLPSFVGFKPVIPHLEDAIARPGEFIPSYGNEILNFVGKGGQALFGGTGGLDQLFSKLTGKPRMPSIPDVGGDIAKSGVAIGGISGGVGSGLTAAFFKFAKPTYTITGITPGGVPVIPVEGITQGISAEEAHYIVSAGRSGQMKAVVSSNYPALAGFNGAIAGAGIGMAVASFMIDITGIGPGIGPAMTYGLMGTAAVSAGVVGFTVASGAAEFSAAAAAAGVHTGFGAAFKQGIAACATGVGCVVAIVVFVLIILFIIGMAIAGVGDIEEKDINFECKPWTPPIFGDCEMCGHDLMSDGSTEQPCNEYACKSLGQNCVYDLESEGPEGGICVSVSPGDASAPRLINIADEITEGFEYAEFVENEGFRVKKIEGECLDGFESVTFGFELDEYGRCRIWGQPDVEFEDMASIGGLSRNQTYSFNSLFLENLGIDSDLESEERNEITLYIACEDVQGTNNENAPFHVNLCVNPRDLTAVSVLDTSGFDWYPFGTDSGDIVAYLSEPAECRWDYQDIPFHDMVNKLNCETDIGNAPFGRFPCTGDIPLLGDVTDICIKCLDHPEWEGTDREQDRNVNAGCNPSLLDIRRSESELKITSIVPGEGGLIRRGTAIVSITAKVQTAGGVDGTADCRYSIDNTGWSFFAQTGGSTHEQVLSQLTAGTHSLSVQCTDAAGDVATESVTFTVEVDTDFSRIARVYDLSGILYVITNEPATCAYTNAASCNFDINNATTMSGVNTLIHSADFADGKTYRIKCTDEFDNHRIGTCDIIVRSGG